MRFPKKAAIIPLVGVTLVALLAAGFVAYRTTGHAATTTTTYAVAFNQTSGLPANVDQMVADAGGKIVARLPEIGGIGVESSNPSFAAQLAANSSVKAVDTETQTKLIDPVADSASGSSGTTAAAGTATGSDTQPMPDPLGVDQWDKKIMDASTNGSYAIQRGRKEVRVFVIDTGADETHIDVAANLDVADSRTFVTSSPVAADLTSIQDYNGHGTWTISAVGAPINGVGISGVAPNVTLVEGKVLNAAGSGEFLWTDEALIYAGLMHFDIVSASLGGFIPKCGNKANPNCDHPDFILLNRATQFARSNGVLPIAALGNNGFDLSDGSFLRSFVEAPGTIAGWVGVAATGYLNDKAFYSNYGSGNADVSAPGGSTRDYRGIPGDPGFCPHPSLCRLVGAWSNTALEAPSNPFVVSGNLYGYVQGTSMATPNAAGVAALIISQYGDFSGGAPHMSPTTVEQYLQQSAVGQPCPTPNTVTQGPGLTFATATCQGNTGYNSFFGKGIVNALNAVTLK